MKIETTRANFKVYFLDLRLPSIPSNLCKTIQLVCKEQTLIYSLRELGRQAYTIVEVVPENFNFIFTKVTCKVWHNFTIVCTFFALDEL